MNSHFLRRAKLYFYEAKLLVILSAHPSRGSSVVVATDVHFLLFFLQLLSESLSYGVF